MFSKSNFVTKEMLNFKRKLQIWVKLLSFALHANMTIKIVSSLKEMMCKEIYIAMMICQFPKKVKQKTFCSTLASFEVCRQGTI